MGEDVKNVEGTEIPITSIVALATVSPKRTD